MSDLAGLLQALRHLYQHAAEPSSDAAHAQALPLLPVLVAACQHAVELLTSPAREVSQTWPAECACVGSERKPGVQKKCCVQAADASHLLKVLAICGSFRYDPGELFMVLADAVLVEGSSCSKQVGPPRHSWRPGWCKPQRRPQARAGAGHLPRAARRAQPHSKPAGGGSRLGND